VSMGLLSVVGTFQTRVFETRSLNDNPAGSRGPTKLLNGPGLLNSLSSSAAASSRHRSYGGVPSGR
jgi:hypothetical protein